MLIKQIEQDLSKEEEFTQSCVDGDKVNSRVITYNIDESVNTIKKSVQRFGEIILETKFSQTKKKRKKKQQAQMFVPKSDNKTIDNITAMLQQQIQTKSQNVKGCCILPNRSMAFTCFDKGEVIVIGNDCEKNFEVNLEGASDLAYLKGDNSIAVSSTSQNLISVIDIQEMGTKSVIQLDSVACGLVERHGSLMYCTSDGIRVIDITVENVYDRNYKAFKIPIY
ncbi:unnamed protein product [Mytilus coruscus]|uniref:Uncharacterized protein n=1 Tax=Mytilus coruscus TaxID=42192 RepID=A0A6J8DRP5_MYTCO|nr:unnamed protein product [Mytilus coruscus]